MKRPLRLLAATALAGACLTSPVFAAALAQGASAPGTVTASQRQVLPTNVTPIAYDIVVRPDPAGLKLKGRVKIEIQVNAATDSVVLNAADLDIDRVALSGVSEAPRITLDPTLQRATFTFAKAIAPGRRTLTIEYRGKIDTQAAGLFALDYPGTDGQQKRALFTQFEAPDARRFVPSWDEPGLKAVFTLAIEAPADQMVISNMPQARVETLGDGFRRTHFKPTPKMSTYLLFMAQGDFERTTVTKGGVEHGVVARKGPGPEQAKFALDASVQLVDYYNDYFATPYPLPKLDHLAGPGQSQFFGAMENWGAIFYFERILLLDPRLGTSNDQQNIYTVVAHEISHQWFGNIVTMSWWDDLWLNEGFASWMESKATAKFHPEWKPEVQAVLARESAMILDARASSHPIVAEINTVEQASQAFDTITYSKGEAVIRMLEAYIGEDGFRDGVRAYMKKHAYANTTTQDLWNALDAANPQRPISGVAKDYLTQTGVPLLRVLDSRCENGSTRLTVRQERFGVDDASKAPTSWRVPVTLQTLGGAVSRGLIEGGQGELTASGCAPVVVNAGQTGYFRTVYTPEQMSALAANFTRVPIVDQLGVLSDTWQQSLAGYTPLAQYLELAQRTPAEADPLVLNQLAGALSTLNGYETGRPGQAAYRAWANSRLKPILNRIGWDRTAEEDPNTITLRATLIAALVDMGDAEVAAEAKRRFEAYVAAPEGVDPSTRRLILSTAAASADAATWERLRALAKASTNPIERQELYGLVASVRDPVLAQRALELSLTDEPPVTSTADMISRVGANHPAMALDFIEKNNAAVNARVDQSSRTRFVPRVVSYASDPAIAARLRAYAAANFPADAMRETNVALAAIEQRSRVRAERTPDVDRWIAATGR
jgi:aminopeptidase N